MLLRKIWEDGEPERPPEKLLVEREETEGIALGYVSVKEGKSTQMGLHDDEEEIFVVLKGKGILSVGNEEQEVSPGSVAYIPRNRMHKVTCTSGEQLEYLYLANWPEQMNGKKGK